MTREKFIECRKALGLTQEQLADRLLLSRNSVNRKEMSGEFNVAVTPRDVRDICEMLFDASMINSQYPDADNKACAALYAEVRAEFDERRAVDLVSRGVHRALHRSRRSNSEGFGE